MKVKLIFLSTFLIIQLPLTSVAASPFGDFASKQTLHYSGTWENTTFSSSDTYEVTLEIDGRNFSMTTTIQGNVFGVGVSIPLTFQGALEEDNLTTLGSNFETYGDVSATIDSSSSPFEMSATSTPGSAVPWIAPSTADATFDFESMSATFVVNFNTGDPALGTSEMSLVEEAPAIQSISPSKSVISGASADLSVETSGSLVSVQWYAGQSGDTSAPVSGATDQMFSTGPLTQAQDFWVRVTNAAGASVDSSTVSMTIGSLWYAGAADLGGGWRWLSWLGYFNVSQEPWIFHQEHGWLFPFADNSQSVFFWDAEMGSIIWTSESSYPSVYRFSDGKWLFYQVGSSNPRWFVDLLTGVWEQW